MLAPVRITPPAETPVTLAEAKAHLRVDHDADDALITALIEAATAHADGWNGVSGRALVTQTWRASLPAFADELPLPVGPVQEVASVTYYDTEGATQTVAAADYVLLTDARGAYVALAPEASWPSAATRADAVTVTWTAGYGAAADVPAPIRQAILLLVGHWYDHRSTVSVGSTVTEVPFAARALLDQYRAPL